MDNIPGKHSEALVSVYHIEALTMRNNAFYLRMPQQFRAIVSYTRKDGNLARQKCNLEMFRKAGGKITGTIFADPRFKFLPKGLLMFKTAPELTQASITRTLNYNKEAVALGKRCSAAELGLVNGKYLPWKITDFISNNPELLKKNIGLKPEAFK